MTKLLYEPMLAMTYRLKKILEQGGDFDRDDLRYLINSAHDD